MSRKKTTGRYETREELVLAILSASLLLGMKVEQIAIYTGASRATVSRILRMSRGLKS